MIELRRIVKVPDTDLTYRYSIKMEKIDTDATDGTLGVLKVRRYEEIFRDVIEK